jgi:FkbM family methyltransferase
MTNTPSTLVYVGTYHGHGAVPFIDKHRQSILIEPNPECASFLRQRFKGYRSVEIIEAAIGPIDHGNATLFLYGQAAGSASILDLTDEAAKACSIDPNPKSVIVQTIRLDAMLKRRNIERIDTLVTDAQGMDLEILEQARPWLERGIHRVQCEVDTGTFRCYDGPRGNNLVDFDKLFASLSVPYCRVTEVNGSHIDCVWELRDHI